MQRLLVLETRMLGDAILSLPFIRGAMEVYDVTVWCLPQSAPIYRSLLPAQNVIVSEMPWMSSKPWIETWPVFFRTLRYVRKRCANVAVTVWPDVRLHLTLALLGVPRRISFPMARQNFFGSNLPWRKRQLHVGQFVNALSTAALLRPLLTQKINKRNSQQRHWMDWQQIAETLGTPWRAEIPWLSAHNSILPSTFTQFIQQERAQDRPIWMVHSGASFANRRWPLERFQKIVDDYFPSQGVSVIIIRPPDSPPPTAQHEHQLDYSTQNLMELIAATAQVDGVLCNDSMMTHLAAALGCRVVSIFSAGGRGWFTPFKNDEFIAYVDVCPHCPCIDRCLMPSPICIEQLGVDVVRQKLDLALATRK